MMTPTVHLNGTGASELLDQVTDAGEAAYELIEALENMAPNGRDYYVQGPSALKKAMAEHQDRIKRVVDLRKELEAIAEAIAGQMNF